MMRRETVWTDDAGDPVQYALALLDDSWDMLWESVYPCGPFHELAERRLQAADDARRWLHAVGHQLELAY